MMIIARAAAVALLLVFGTVGCAPSETPQPVVGVPSTTPVVEAPAVFTVVLTSTTVNLLDEEGETVGEYDYFDADATPLVTALNDAFGADVKGVPQGGGGHTAYELYSWDGLQVQDFVDSDDPARSGNRINVVKPTVAGVDVEVIGGVRIGSPSADVEPLAFENRIDSGSGIDIRIFLLDKQLVALEGSQPDTEMSVALWADEPNGRVYNIFAGQSSGE